MTTTYTAYAGDTQQIEIDVGDEAGAPLDLTGAALVYILRSRAGVEVLRKTTGDGITVAGNTATVTIDAGDTATLGSGQAYHELQCTDVAGNVSTLLAGWVTFTRTEIAP